MKYNRIRFKTHEDDFRPVKFPPPGPYWRTGSGEDERGEYSTLVAYWPVGAEDEFILYWPEVYWSEVDILDEDVDIQFTARFARPEWYHVA